jgi:type VI secretion system secreted protein Hcp
MAFDAFLKLDGVTGESTDDKNKGQIEIYSFSWGASNPVTIGSQSTGSGAGKVSFASFSITKKLDSSSPTLLKNCCIGDHFKTGSLTLRKAGGDQLAYLEYDFTEIYIDSYQVNGSSGGDDTPSESISMTAASVVMKYSAQSAEGKMTPMKPAGWNLTTNKPM